ncbi:MULTISPECIES: FecCD family ABC transporter permease [Marinobacter]|uniref:FecCD family ABC transporter permease n=1 Tax=Marinobacter TaxID=2742 RepID=UPI001244BB56|nr:MULTISPECIES: iron ABC transporter permease [Marinobacter]MBL3556337.1 iron ABC transporter permease [Marinobacter sp. JB05H06]
MNHTLVLRTPGDRWSVKLNVRVLVVTLTLALLLAVSSVLALASGSHPTSFTEVLGALAAPEQSELALIILEIRMPRVLMAVLVGGALGSAGLILQGLVRNPLASPDVIGITSGASAAAVLYLWLGGITGTSLLLAPVAMGGAFAVALCITTLAWRQGISPYRLVLVGVGLAAALTAVTTLLLVLSPDSTAMNAYIWLTGSLYASQWHDVTALAPWLVVCWPLALIKLRHLDAQAMGEDMALGLGSALQGHRLLFLVLAVALAGSAVAYAGAVGFIGLIAPHMARRLLASGHTGLLPIAALIGSLILLYADWIGRVAFIPRDLPAGVFVAGIGAPFFVYLLYRLRRDPG